VVWVLIMQGILSNCRKAKFEEDSYEWLSY